MAFAVSSLGTRPTRNESLHKKDDFISSAIPLLLTSETDKQQTRPSLGTKNSQSSIKNSEDKAGQDDKKARPSKSSLFRSKGQGSHSASSEKVKEKKKKSSRSRGIGKQSAVRPGLKEDIGKEGRKKSVSDMIKKYDQLDESAKDIQTAASMSMSEKKEKGKGKTKNSSRKKDDKPKKAAKKEARFSTSKQREQEIEDEAGSFTRRSCFCCCWK